MWNSLVFFNTFVENYKLTRFIFKKKKNCKPVNMYRMIQIKDKNKKSVTFIRLTFKR